MERVAAATAASPHAATAAKTPSADTATQMAAGASTRNGAARRATSSAPSSRRVTRTATGVVQPSTVRVRAQAKAPPRPTATSPTYTRSAPGGWPATCVGQLPCNADGDPVHEPTQEAGDVVDLAGGEEVLVVVLDLVRQSRATVDVREPQGPRQRGDVRRGQERGPRETTRDGGRPHDAEHPHGNGDRRTWSDAGVDPAGQRREGTHRVQAGAHPPVPQRRDDDGGDDEEHRHSQTAPSGTVGPVGWHADRLGGIAPGRSSARPTSGFRNPEPSWSRPRIPSVNDMEIPACDLVLPCRDEAAALPALLAEVPPGLRGDRGRQRLARPDRRDRRAPGSARRDASSVPGTAPPSTRVSRPPPRTSSR